jgi:hypothetical protein
MIDLGIAAGFQSGSISASTGVGASIDTSTGIDTGGSNRR